MKYLFLLTITLMISLEVFSQEQNPRAQIDSLLQLSKNDSLSSDKKIELAEKALHLANNNGLTAIRITILIKLANLHYRKKDYDRQFSYLKKRWELSSREEIIRQTVYLSLFHGIFLAMALYSLLIFFTIRDLTFLHYSLSLLFISIHLTFNNDFFQIHLALPPFNYHIVTSYATFIAAIFFTHYTRCYFNSRTLFPFWDKVLRYCALTYFLVCFSHAGYFLSWWGNWAIILSTVQDTIFFLILMTFSCYAHFHKYKPAIYYLVANTMLFITGFIYIVTNAIIRIQELERNQSVFFIFSLGIALQTILYAFAISARINILRREVTQKQIEQEKLQKEKILEINQLIEQKNIELEQKVKQRTYELQNANEELIQLNEELHQKSEEISTQRDHLEDAFQKLKQAQAQLVQSEKMSSIGLLTAGIAHEINNPINFISSNIDSLKENIEDIMVVLREYDRLNQSNYESQLIKIQQLKKAHEFDLAIEELDQLIQGISEGATRTTQIIQGLRTFSRLDEDVLKMTDVHENIDATLTLLQNRYKNRIEIIKNYGHIPAIEAYPGKLNQVFMNLLSNAIEAIEGKGTISISTGLVHTTQNTAHSPQSIVDSKNAMDDGLSTMDSKNDIFISIQDSGEGMSEAVKERIFEPFFTTKPVGKGVGLGLSIVHSIVERHGGRIEVESEVGKGTAFRVILPIHQKTNQL